MSPSLSLPIQQQIDLPPVFNLSSEVLKENILIVEDSSTVRKLFVRILSAHYNCIEAASDSEAFAQLSEKEFALVITDVMIPCLSGIKLLGKITEAYPDTAVIIVSGMTQPHLVQEALRLGAFDYLFKPFDLNVLKLTVKRALEKRSLMINARRYKKDLEARDIELARCKAQLECLQTQILNGEKLSAVS